MAKKYTKTEFIQKTSDKLAGFEPERYKWILRLFAAEIITALITWLLFKGIFYFEEAHSVLAAACSILFFVGIIIFFANIIGADKDFKIYIKEKCKQQILKAFDIALSKIGFDDDELKARNLFTTYTYSETDDVIKGKYNNVDYEVAETKLVVKGRKNEYEVFNGVIISFKSNKNFTTETLVTTKGDNNIRNYPPYHKFVITLFIVLFIVSPIIFSILFWVIAFGKLLSFEAIKDTLEALFFNPETILFNIFNLLLPVAIIALVAIPVYIQKKKMQDVKLEDTTFDKKFNVYTKDQIEARYLLTPTFMERLKSIETSFGTKGIKCSFFNNQIMIAIPTKKDLFELGSLYKSLNSTKAVEEFYDQLDSIYKMIDHLKLNEKIGL